MSDLYLTTSQTAENQGKKLKGRKIIFEGKLSREPFFLIDAVMRVLEILQTW